MTDRNLYAPPSTQVRDVKAAMHMPGGLSFIPEGRGVSAGQGWQWFAHAWRVFKARPLVWWLTLMAVFGLFVLVSIVPSLGVVAGVSFPLIMAGIGSCALSVMQTGRFEVRQAFDGFRQRPGALLLAGAVIMVTATLFMLVFVALMGGGISLLDLYTGDMASRQAASVKLFEGVGGLAVLFYIVMMSVIGSMMMFAPYLIHEQGLSVIEAMKKSMQGSFRNVPAGLVAVLVYIVLGIAASIPLMLGWLVLFPVLMLVSYTAYRDIYFQGKG